jgi:hypothetical protein
MGSAWFTGKDRKEKARKEYKLLSSLATRLQDPEYIYFIFLETLYDKDKLKLLYFN